MHQMYMFHGINVFYAFVIMDVVTIPIRVGSKDNVFLNSTVPLSHVALSMQGTDAAKQDMLIPLSGLSETNGILLETGDTDIDYEFEDITPAEQADTTPEYMLELYNNMSRNSPFLHNSNIIRSFKHIPQLNNKTEHVSSIQGHACVGCRIHSLFFDISTIYKTESINSAELRLYTLIKRDQNTYMGVNRLVKIYEVLNETDRNGNYKYNFITSKYIHKLENAWESFEVTSAVKRTIQSGCKTEHLEVRIQSMFTGYKDDTMDINADPNHIKQPILVVYSNDRPEHEIRSDRHEVIMHELSAKKQASHKYHTRLTDTSTNHNYGQQNVPHTRSKRSKNLNRNSECRRRPMYVNFADIDFGIWVIAPRGYQAYQCAGRCWFPISEHLSPSSHAAIQALLNEQNHRRAGRACCVPTELAPISMLYIDSQGVVTYKYMFDGMVVSKCGCR